MGSSGEGSFAGLAVVSWDVGFGVLLIEVASFNEVIGATMRAFSVMNRELSHDLKSRSKDPTQISKKTNNHLSSERSEPRS